MQQTIETGIIGQLLFYATVFSQRQDMDSRDFYEGTHFPNRFTPFNLIVLLALRVFSLQINSDGSLVSLSNYSPHVHTFIDFPLRFTQTLSRKGEPVSRGNVFENKIAQARFCAEKVLLSE